MTALTFIGMIDQSQNRTAQARQAFERVLTMDPRAAVAANNLAWIYAENGGSLDRALQLAQLAASALPNQAEVHDTLGWVQYKQSQLPGAIAALHRSVELDPANGLSAYHLALAYAQSGDREQSRQMLQLSLKLEPTSERAVDIRRRLESAAP